MISTSGVSPKDWMGLVAGVAGLLVGYLQSRDRLPKWARLWLGRIGRDRIVEAIDYAAKLADMTNEQRSAEAAAYLVRLSEKELGFAVPDSIANLLVEYVFQQVKRKQV